MLLSLPIKPLRAGTPNTLPPDPPCQEVIRDLANDCEIAMEKADQAIAGKDQIIAGQDDALRLQAKAYDELQASTSAWYNSKVTWGVLGLILGVVIAK
jgi:hypothetical protein